MSFTAQMKRRDRRINRAVERANAEQPDMLARVDAGQRAISADEEETMNALNCCETDLEGTAGNAPTDQR